MNGKFSVGIDVLDRVAKALNRKIDIVQSEGGTPPRQSEGVSRKNKAGGYSG